MLNVKFLPIEFVPVRISKSATIILHDNITKVFPLFGPVREMEWAEDWSPEILYGHSDAEEHMVFRTHGDNELYQWVITQFNPEKFYIEYTVSATDRIWFIRVDCKPYGEETMATITYTYIGLTQNAHARNQKGMERIFSQNLNDWEEAINHYVTTGRKLKH
jgi:hypothetical protein